MQTIDQSRGSLESVAQSYVRPRLALCVVQCAKSRDWVCWHGADTWYSAQPLSLDEPRGIIHHQANLWLPTQSVTQARPQWVSVTEAKALREPQRADARARMSVQDVDAVLVYWPVFMVKSHMLTHTRSPEVHEGIWVVHIFQSRLGVCKDVGAVVRGRPQLHGKYICTRACVCVCV